MVLTVAVQLALKPFLTTADRAEMNRLARAGQEDAARAILQGAYQRYLAARRKPRYLSI